MNLNDYIKKSEMEFSNIDSGRKEKLLKLSNYINSKIANNEEVNLIFICTHNSRRSHMAQLWAAKAAAYYGLDNIMCYSGGTEATAFNLRSVKAMRKSGFEINLVNDSKNSLYNVIVDEKLPPVKAFSKKYDDDFNPKENFAAVMTCSDADENCPFITGAEQRIAITYDDPKEFDGTELEEQKYDERCKQIATEMLFIMKNVK